MSNSLNGNIKNVIGIMSGKGGVGKSTVTTMLAKDLAKRGFKVGIMDADITGPSIPRLMNVRDKKVTSDGKNMIPVVSEDGIKVISLNLLLADENQPVIWRGSLIGNAVKQFWEEVLWGDLDYLLIDMPPGTGDVALTVMQTIPLTGVVMVSIPQDMVSMIVTKAVNMANKLKVKILGIVENMSYIPCPECSTKINFHNKEENDKFLAQSGIRLLGELPMTRGIALLSTGREDEENSKIFAKITDNILDSIQ